MRNNEAGLPSQSNEHDEAGSYLQQAANACAAGDAVLGMHLYLAAFEQVQHESGGTPTDEAVNSLKKAWSLAYTLKERSIAEYIFSRMEPYLSDAERARYGKQLQELALDKLEEFGMPREQLEGIANMFSSGLFEGDANCLIHVEGPGARPAKGAKQAQAKAPRGGQPAPCEPKKGEGRSMAPSEFGTYKDLVGFDEAVGLMHRLGIGMEKDPEFAELVKLLNRRHGLDAMPAVDSLLFRSPAREDSNRFMAATAGELGLPVVRMRMEENMQGVPILCVMAQSDRQPKMNHSRTSFEGPAVLLLEDLDTWVSPADEQSFDDLGGFLMASLSRGAREAVTLIRSAVENPDVYVLASSGDLCDVEPFFYDVLAPVTVVDIDYPTDAERADIWMDIAKRHPSMRSIDRAALVRYSRAMPRYDIYMAVREAIEETYKQGLSQRRYAPVTPDNIFDKLAAYQPLDSDEYRELEDAVVSDFRRDLEHIDDLLKGPEDE